MRDTIINYEAKRERAEKHRAQDHARAYREDYLALRKLMREYFRENLNEPHNQLPEEIKKAIGLK